MRTPLVLSAFLAAQAAAEVPAPLTCLLAPARVSEIGTDLRALVTEVPVRRADAVAEGDVLVRLDTALAEAERRLAEITVQGLAARLARTEDLAGRNLVSRDEIEQLTTDLAVARAELARAELAIDRAAIRAPFSGIVSAVAVTEGELSGSEPLLTLIETDTLHAEMVFVDGAFGAFAPGDPVRAAIDLTGDRLEGRITRIDPFIDPASNSFTAVAEIPNLDGAVPAGVSCRVLGPGE